MKHPLELRINPDCVPILSPVLSGSTFTVLTCDDFLEQPGEVEQALFSEPLRDVPGFFPGGNLSAAKVLSGEVGEFLLKHFSGLRPDIRFPGIYGMQYEVEDSRNVYFRKPHVDFCDLAYIVYLNHESEYEGGGLGFYCNETVGIAGFEMRSDDEALAIARELGLNCPEQMLSFVHKFEQAWKLVQFVPVAYNRLVAFTPDIFHMPIAAKGSHANRRILRGVGQSLTYRNDMAKLWDVSRMGSHWVNQKEYYETLR